MSTEKVIASLKEKGLKATHQRIVIYSELLVNPSHPRAEELYESLKPSNPSLSLATLYKTLESFEEVGLVNKVLTREGVARYDAITAPHAHIISTNTKEIMDIEDPELVQLINDYIRRKHFENFALESISINLEGQKIDKRKKIKFS